HRAIDRAVLDELHKQERSPSPRLIKRRRPSETTRPQRARTLTPQELANNLGEPVAHQDDDVEDAQLAKLILHHPERFLPPSLLRVYVALQEHATPGAAAKSLGMKPKVFYVMTRKLKKRI